MTSKLINRISFLPLILLIILSILFVGNHGLFLQKYNEPLFTFCISFIVGMGGAGIYLILLLMTEKDLAILQNKIIPNLTAMVSLFLISGGFVSAITQTATGSISTSSLYSIFMIGFGWQGALSGIAGSGAIKDKKEEVEIISRARDIENMEKEVIAKRKDREIQDIREALKEALQKE